MIQKERMEKMGACGRFNRCSASVCGLDPLGEGCYVQGDKVCPYILDYLEGKEFPLKGAVEANEHLWRKHLSEKFLARRLDRRKKFREYWTEKNCVKEVVSGVDREG